MCVFVNVCIYKVCKRAKRFKVNLGAKGDTEFNMTPVKFMKVPIMMIMLLMILIIPSSS